MRYVYYCCACEKNHEVQKPMLKAMVDEFCPDCGSQMGRDWQAEGAQGATYALKNEIKGYPYVSSRLPKNLPGCDTDKKGRPVITSKSHEKEVMARHGYRRD